MASLLVGPGCAATPPQLHVAPARTGSQAHASGSRAGGEAVLISGAQRDADGELIPLTGHGPVALYFGNRSAVGVVIEGDYLIRAITPKRETAGPVDVRLAFDDGVVLTIEDGYEYKDVAGIVLSPSIVR